MTVLPLDQIGFGWRSHWSALWWLFLLYRRPKEFQESLSKLTRRRQLFVGFVSYLHAVPWVIVACLTGQFLLLTVGLAELRSDVSGAGDVLWAHGKQIALGVILGVILGIAIRSTVGVTLGLIFGIVGAVLGIVGIDTVVATGITVGVIGLAACIILGIVGSKPVFELRIAYMLLGYYLIYLSLAIVLIQLAGYGIDLSGRIHDIGYQTLIDSAIINLSIVVALMILWHRMYYIPLSIFAIWPLGRGRCYSWHPIAWDQMCGVPYPRLDRLLVAYFEYDPGAARAEVNRLIDTYPSQRWRALKAKAVITARDSTSIPKLTHLPAVIAALPEGHEGFLRQVPRLRELAAVVAERQQQLDQATYPTVRKKLAELLVQQIEHFRDQVAGFEEPLRTEFRKAALLWLDRARGQFPAALGTQADATAQLFRAGDPVDREQEAFVDRAAVVAELEQQVFLATGCPGLILYGRRRVGKSTVLRNLTGRLSSSVPVGYISMQNPQVFTSVEGFCRSVAGTARAATWWDANPPTETHDLSGLMRLLSWYDDHLGRAQQRLVLALDEYEMIDTKIGAGVFGTDLLATFRESIQSHRNLTWVFAGTHEIAELTHAEWPSYLISARTVEVLPFAPAETRQLLTDPMRHSRLWRDEAKRPRFTADFWGAGGIDRIHADAGGWPHLVQLLAETAVDVVNAEGATAVTDEMYGRVREKAVVRGDTVLRQLLLGEVKSPGEREYLTRFRKLDDQPPPDDEAVERSIRRRLLVEAAGGRWRLRVPLMRQWLRDRG